MDQNNTVQDQHATQREAVRQIQRYLRQLAFFDSRITAPPVDGIFGTATENALVEFQRQQNLPQTGQADYLTWTRLFESYTNSITDHAGPMPVAVFPASPEGYTIGKGNTTLQTRVIQYLLNELSVSYTDTRLPEETLARGVFDQNTADAVSAFQKLNGFPATGEVDVRTWNRLTNEVDSDLHTGE